MSKPTHATIPVRIEQQLADKVRNLSEKLGVKDAVFIRWAIDALLRYVDEHQGTLHLPIDFRKLWSEYERAAAELTAEANRGELRNAPGPRPVGKNDPVFDEETPRDSASPVQGKRKTG